MPCVLMKLCVSAFESESCDVILAPYPMASIHSEFDSNNIVPPFHFNISFYFVHLLKIIKNSKMLQIDPNFFPHSCFDL